MVTLMAAYSILIVDDDVEFLRALSTVLSREGYVVAGARNPGAAMEFVTQQHHHFDLVITDLSMPGHSGIAVLRSVKAAFPNLPVIIVTAFGTNAVQTEARSLGVSAFVTKPFERDRFLRVVAETLGENASPRTTNHHKRTVHTS